jgi:phage tail sheath gpL-like
MASFISGQLEPGVFVAFDPSAANQSPGLLQYSALLIGQRTAAAAAAPGAPAANTIHQVFGEADVIKLGGRGSILHRQAIGWYAANRQTELWIGILDDDGAGVAATGTITVTGPATASGTISLYLGGERITVGVSDGDIADDIAAAIDTAINAELDLPVTSSVLAAVVTLTFGHKGLVGNEYDVRHSHNPGEVLPDGVGLTIVPLASGTANPDLSGLIANMGDQWFNVLTHPYTDATSLADLGNELADRTRALRQIDGVAFTAATGSVGTLAALGQSINDEHHVIVSQPGEPALTPSMEVAAEVAGQVAISAQGQPNLPLHALELVHTKQPAQADLFTRADRNDGLARNGIATTGVVANAVSTQGMVTTYTLNASGQPDTSYQRPETLFTLMFLRYSFRQWFGTKYARALIGGNDARARAGTQLLTPNVARGEALAWFDAMATLGLVQNRDLFADNLVIEIDAQNSNQMNFLLPPALVKALVVVSGIIQFR